MYVICDTLMSIAQKKMSILETFSQRVYLMSVSMSVSSSASPVVVPLGYDPSIVNEMLQECEEISRQQCRNERPIGSLAKHMAAVVERVCTGFLPPEMTAGDGNCMLEDYYFPPAVRWYLDAFVIKKFNNSSSLDSFKEFCESFFVELVTVRFAVEARQQCLSYNQNAGCDIFIAGELPLRLLEQWLGSYARMGISIDVKQKSYLDEHKIYENQLKTLIVDFYCVRLDVFIRRYDSRNCASGAPEATLKLELGPSHFKLELESVIMDIVLKQELEAAGSFDEWADKLMREVPAMI